MKRVPASLALLALHQSGHVITPAALRNWVYRGHVTRGPGGYDLEEIVAYLDRRTAQRNQQRAAA
jgi:hypothetical protein